MGDVTQPDTDVSIGDEVPSDDSADPGGFVFLSEDALRAIREIGDAREVPAMRDHAETGIDAQPGHQPGDLTDS